MKQTREELFNCLVVLEQNLKSAQEDIKQVKSDFTYDEVLNVNGLDKVEVKEIAAFAKKCVANNIESIIEQGDKFKEMLEEFKGV